MAVIKPPAGRVTKGHCGKGQWSLGYAEKKYSRRIVSKTNTPST